MIRHLRLVATTLMAILLAAAVILLGVYHHRDRETFLLDDTARNSPAIRAYGGSYVRLPSGVTHYELIGPQSAPTIVLIHGFSVPYYIWDPVIQALAAGGFRVLRYDLYGRGWSDRPDVRYTPEFFDEQLVQLLEALEIHQPIDLISVSMGGPIAVNFAVLHPDRTRKVVLFDPGFTRGFRPPWLLRAPVVSDFLMCVKIAPTFAPGQRDDFLHPERYPGYFAKYEPQMNYRGFRRALLSTIRDFLTQDTQPAFEHLGNSGKPVLLVWGRADQDVPFAVSDDVRKAIPQAEFHAIDDAAHVPFYEHPEITDPLLIDFLRR